jgi:hypothetical protein
MYLGAVQARVLTAYEALITDHSLLLEYDANERAIASKLQGLLAGVFPAHDVDFEYNRHGLDPKRISWPGSDQEPTELVIPDLVIHHRGIDNKNLLVVEVKKSSASAVALERDRGKLRAIAAAFGYEHWALLRVPTGPGASAKGLMHEWDF